MLLVGSGGGQYIFCVKFYSMDILFSKRQYYFNRVGWHISTTRLKIIFSELTSSFSLCEHWWLSSNVDTLTHTLLVDLSLVESGRKHTFLTHYELTSSGILWALWAPIPNLASWLATHTSLCGNYIFLYFSLLSFYY